MQKKFWSALLSLAMIVSCFSGVALASGGRPQGQPSYQMTSPNNVNINMNGEYGAVRNTVVVAPGSMTFSGALMSQGSESPTEYLTSQKVGELYTSITGFSLPVGSEKHMVFGELKTYPHVGQNTGTQVKLPKYSNSYTDNSLVSDSSGRYMVSHFSTYDKQLLKTVDADGRFSFTEVFEPHTTRYFGFALSDMVFKSGNELYGVFESTVTGATGGNSAAQEAYLAAKINYDQMKALKAASVAYTSFEANDKELYEALLPALNGLIKLQTDFTNQTGLPFNSVAVKSYSDEIVELVNKLQNLGTKFGSLTFDTHSSALSDANRYYETSMALLATSDSNLNAVKFPADVARASHMAGPLPSVGEFVRAAQALGTLNSTQRTLAAAAVNNIANSLTTLNAAVLSAYSVQQTATDFKTAVDTAFASFVASVNPSVATVSGYTNILDDVTSIYGDYCSANEAELARYTAEVVRLEGIALASGSVLPQTTAKSIQYRYLQGTPLTLRMVYKLKDGASSYTSGTYGNVNISGTFVDANGNVMDSRDDFDYVVYDGSYSSSKSPIYRGSTKNGFYSFTIYGIYSNSIYLYPITRYDRMSNTTLKLDLSDGAQLFPYTVATATRRPFVKAELEENMAVSVIKPMQIKYDELFTYEAAPQYSGIRPATSKIFEAASYPGTELVLYGVSYIVYAADSNDLSRIDPNKMLTKQYKYKTASNLDVDWNWEFGSSSSDYTEINEASTGIAPAFRLDTDGYMTFGGTRVHILFKGTGTAMLRTRVAGRYINAAGSTAAEQNELFQSIVNITVDGPSAVNVIEGNAIKSIDAVNHEPHKIVLRSQDDAMANIVMTNIRYDGKPDTEHTMVFDNDKKNAVDYKLVYNFGGGSSGTDAFIYIPWDLIEIGGADLEIDVDIFDNTSNKDKITSRTIVIKNELWKLTSSVEQLTVQVNNNFSAVVVDHNDVEQNNSQLFVVDSNTTVQNPLSHNAVGNIIRGTYEFKNVYPRSGGDVYLYVREDRGISGSPIKAMVSMQALGLADYTGTLTEGKDKGVVGLAKTIEFTAVKKDGSAATDLTQFNLMTLDGKKASNFAKYEKLIPTTSSNGKYAVSVVGLKPGTYILRAATSAMEHYVDFEFEVLPLTITFSDDAGKLTWSYDRGRYSPFREANHLNFTVTDPLTQGKVNVAIADTLFKYVKQDGEPSELDASLIKVSSFTSTTPVATKGITITDKDYLDYRISNNRDSHDFYVEVVDQRSETVRSSEGQLGLKFYFKVKDQNSVGTENTVDGFIIPVELPTLTATPDKVVRGVQQTIELTVHDANGRPLAGIAVRPDVETQIAELTNSEGKTTYLFTAVVTGVTKRFDIEGFERSESNQVFTIVKIEDDNTPPTLALDPYISKTTKNSVTITGTAQDNLGLSKLTVDSTLVNISMTNETSFPFEFVLDLRSGMNTFRIVLTDVTGRTTAKTIKIEHLEPSVTVLTLNSTEVSSSDSGVSGTALDSQPTNVSGRVCLPLRFVFETILKGTVDYKDGVITSSAMGHEIVMTVGSQTALVDGKEVTLLVAPFIDSNNRALAPIREILESCGVTVNYDATSGRITIVGAGDVDVITTTDLVAPAEAAIVEETPEVVEEEETPAVTEEEETPEVEVEEEETVTE